MPVKSRRVSLLLAACTTLLVILFTLFSPQNSEAQQRPPTEPLPSNVRIETVLENMRMPVAMVFDPAGRLFYTEKTGAVRLFANGQLQPNPVISFSVSSLSERGLLGIALDPNFNTNRYVYVYYTSTEQGGCSNFGVENRVVRFTENNGVGANPTTI